MEKLKYVNGIQKGFEYIMENHPDCLIIGQGLWSPFYVGRSMANLEENFGRDKVIDSPIAENTVTGIAFGAALTGMRSVVVHPRMDFMILACDQIVNQISKWQSMLGGGIPLPITIRGIINRGGEQGAQHSQALHSWFAHIPGIRVVMPATPIDARDLLIASILSDDPVLYIDDKWCYDSVEEDQPVVELDIRDVGPKIVESGEDITIVSAGCLTQASLQAKRELNDISCEVIDLRVINPLNIQPIIKSVTKTKRLLVVDGGWKSCGLAGEIIASVMESIDFNLICPPSRLTLYNSPAPTSKVLEQVYYVQKKDIVNKIKSMATR
jgi:acetoin:2,6-dichlorophenolindophenol oxidoreductase subunit beta